MRYPWYNTKELEMSWSRVVRYQYTDAVCEEKFCRFKTSVTIDLEHSYGRLLGVSYWMVRVYLL